MFRSVVEMMAFRPPIPAGYESGDSRVKKIKSKDDGHTVPVYFSPARTAGRNLTIIYSHGNGQDLETSMPICKVLSEVLDANVVGYDYTGYGPDSDRQPSEVVFDWVKSSGVPDSSVILYGKSLGSGPTLHLASQCPHLRGVVLQSPFLSVVRVVTWMLPFDWIWGDIFVNQNKIGHVKSPVLFIHGRADQVVPFSHGQHLHATHLASQPQAAFPPTWIDNAGHNDIEHSYSHILIEALRQFCGDL
jgi:pimeloyl-ACP methyl ester carboxylesterase